MDVTVDEIQQNDSPEPPPSVAPDMFESWAIRARDLARELGVVQSAAALFTVEYREGLLLRYAEAEQWATYWGAQ